MNLKHMSVAILALVMIPTNIVVAEPFLGSIGNQAINSDTALIAKPSLDRFSGRRVKVEVSAYNLVPGQTDSTPCIGANGADLCLPSNRYTIATNSLPFGTKVIIPSIDAETVWVVRDRMNARYGDNIDVMVQGTDAEAIAEARQIGRRTREVIILD
jgi:3D (Asp-Asp-Asp) domain-containing protein